MKHNHNLEEIVYILFMGSAIFSFLTLSAFIIVSIYMLCTTGSLSM